MVLATSAMNCDFPVEPYSESFSRRLAKMAAKPKLDVQVCDHCNLRCAGCLHFAPLAEKTFLDLDVYEHDLARLAAIEGISDFFGAVALMGGEPLLHPHIDAVMQMTRDYLPNEVVALCTNGLLLKRMDDNFWNTLVACDIKLVISPYPINVDYEALAAIACSKGTNVDFARDITGTSEGKEAFMRLALDPTGGCDPAKSFTSCPFGGCYLQLARGAIWPCQVAAHHESFTNRFGYAMYDGPEDSLALDSIATADQIDTFRRHAHPMCRYCNNDALTVAPWKRSALTAQEWLAGYTG